ncbi:unnamed protein product [Prorocentrum cordatum]|uniref:Succinate dehydrogenase assembly factor 3 n=1 Tax=Prorocentrum cordatum TaxID=2364126 RepID=A0ABN9XEL4_9DINO|nr:unnamed protein product [Polarella glacialis]
MGLPAIVNAEGKGLFRSIMRMHRTKLPQTMRSLGDAYVRKEFRLHYKPEVEGKHRTMFVGEWKKYVAMISSQEDVVGQAARRAGPGDAAARGSTPRGCRSGRRQRRQSSARATIGCRVRAPSEEEKEDRGSPGLPSVRPEKMVSPRPRVRFPLSRRR